MPKGDTIFYRLENATLLEKKSICKALGLEGEQDFSNETISAEYRANGGHTLLNIFRDVHELPYKKILVDVADKLKPGTSWTIYKWDDSFSEKHIENEILEYLKIDFEMQMNKISFKEREAKKLFFEEELKKKGYSQAEASAFGAAFVSGTAGAGFASVVTLSIFYSGFFSSIWASIFGVSTALLGATFIGLTALFAAPLLITALGNPAYRKTIPATLEFIKIRMRLEMENTL